MNPLPPTEADLREAAEAFEREQQNRYEASGEANRAYCRK